MEVSTINAAVFAKMFLAGAKNLEAKKEWINELNVFPVPDGDTGTNMSMTIMSAAKAVSELENPTDEGTCKGNFLGFIKRSKRKLRSYPFPVIPWIYQGDCRI